MAVVKAFCYGHGLEIAKLLYSFGLRDFGVSSVEEGCELKKVGVRGNIYILGGFLPWEAEVVVQEEFIPIVSSRRDLESLRSAAKKLAKRVFFHLKIDTGMGRLGFLPSEFPPSILEEYLGDSLVQMGGVLTHFSSAESDAEYTRGQFALFREFLERHRLSSKNLVYHCCNSAAFLQFPEMHLHMSRVGIALLGVSPTIHSKLTRESGLEPVAQLKTRIKYIKCLPSAFRVGYGGTFTTSRETQVAIVALGYAQGVFRNLSNKMEVLVRGKRARVIGNISMDQLAIDVTEIQEAQEGDVVTIIGEDGAERIEAEELARLANTIPHEILCSLKKVPHRVVLYERDRVATRELC